MTRVVAQSLLALASLWTMPAALAPLATPGPLCYAAVQTPLSLGQIEALALSVGFPGGIARTMARIAHRESRGLPWAIRKQGRDLSFGLWQLNIRRTAWFEWFGVRQPADLLDPETNARAALKLWRAYGMKPWGGI